MIFWVYVDYLNVFWEISARYGIFWIDYEKLFLRLLQKKFPTARIGKMDIYYSMLSGDTAKNQDLHINALKLYSQNINLIQGHHKSVSKVGPIKEPGCSFHGIEVRIGTREEKHTDMNMGCQILYDALIDSDKFKYQALVTNDSDFATPLSFKRKIKQESVLIAPIPEASKNIKHISLAKDLRHLTRSENRIMEITLKDLLACLLPDVVGKYKKPPDESWLNKKSEK